MSHLNSRVARIVAGLAVVSAFAVAPMAAQAAPTDTTDANGTLTGGVLSVTAPDIDAFGVTLTGIVQTVNTEVDPWNLTDPTGSDDGYNVTVSAIAPTVDADGVGAGAAAVIAGSTLKLYTTDAQASGGNTNTAPVAQADAQLDVLAAGGYTASTIQSAAVNTGQGPWDFARDAGAGSGLEVVIPGTATPGAYASTLTYTIAVPVI